MSKIRMNTEYRNKLFNRIKDVFEKEETQERQGFLEARENFENKQTTAFELARQVVERSYPMEDVNTLRQFKKKYGDPCDVVAKDKCFYFSHMKMLMRTAIKKKLNHILILVCMAISMVMSMVRRE
jgi:hypothetical protein